MKTPDMNIIIERCGPTDDEPERWFVDLYVKKNPDERLPLCRTVIREEAVHQALLWQAALRAGFAVEVIYNVD